MFALQARGRQLLTTGLVLGLATIGLAGPLAGIAEARGHIPAPTITSYPANPTNQTTASFSFTDKKATSFVCAMDSTTAYAACASPKTYSGLGGGNHTFRVKGVNSGTLSNPTSYSWKINTVPPAAPTIAPVPTPTNNTSASISFTDSDPTATSFTCALDGVAAVACASPHTVSGLAQGPHTVVVTAFNTAGNSASSSVTWTVDTTAPSSPVVVVPSSPTNQTSASITWTDSSTDISSYSCSLDGAAGVTCTSPYALTGLAQGTHTIAVIPTDTAGNVGVAGTGSWTVDTTPPTAPVINTGPAADTNQTAATFSFTDTDPSVAGYSCVLDGVAADCVSPVSYNTLTSGNHTFSVTASDAAGNVSAPASESWTIDTTVPGPVSFTDGPAAESNVTTPTFYFDPTDPTNTSSYLCSLDNEPFWASKNGAPCTTAVQVSVSGDGQHVFAVKAVNTVGTASSPATYTWTLDTTPPTFTGFTGPADPTNQTSGQVSFSTDEVTSFTCALDSGAAAACSSPYSMAGLADGSHTVTVTATDDAGNTALDSHAWTVDTTPPSFTSLTGPANPTNLTSGQVSFAVNEAATFACALDGAAATSCTSPYPVSGLANGSHTVTITATDAAGNRGTDSYTWTVNTAAPAFTAITGPANPTNQTSGQVTFSTSPAAAYTCALDGGAAGTCTSPYGVSGLRDGSHTVIVTATDTASNTSADSYSWTVDTVPPSFTSMTGPASPTTQTSGQITFATNEATTFTCALDSAAATSCASPYPVSGLSVGPHTVTVTATDAAGNTAPDSYTWTVSAPSSPAPPPAPTFTATPPSLSNQSSAKFSFTDAQAGVTFTCALDATAATTCSSPLTVSGLSDGGHTVTVAAVDGHGATTPAAYSWTVDTSAPSASTVPPTTLTGADRVVFSKDVQGVTAASVQLDVDGTTNAVPVSYACFDASGAAVSCSGTVRSLTLTPIRPLVPGQYYRVSFNGDPVADAAGNPVGNTLPRFRAATLQEEGSVAASYGWRVGRSTAAIGGSFVVEHSAGAAASYVFHGARVTWYTVTGRSQGLAYVYVDGQLRQRVNNYASTTHYRVARVMAVGGLAGTVHTLRIVVAGVRGSMAGTDSQVVIDAVKVGSTVVATPILHLSWRYGASRLASGSRFTAANLAGDSASITFRGTSITWYTLLGSSQGLARVYIDGVLRTTVNNYAASSRALARRFTVRDGVHTIRILVLGTHSRAAKGSWVVVDTWAVG